MGAMGVGAVIGTLVLARRTRISGLPRVMTYSGFFVGCAYLAFGLSPSLRVSRLRHAADRAIRDAPDGVREYDHPDADPGPLQRADYGALFDDGRRSGPVRESGRRALWRVVSERAPRW